ncbi:MAG TPA: tetratricopeptide repeat protein [Spirochaetota bacterium]|nr:tetratricopeptide repeat protein [Spirochaetota bacterium]
MFRLTPLRTLLLLMAIFAFANAGDGAAAQADKNEDQVKYYNKLGVEKLKENKFEEAVQYFDKAIALKPGDAPSWNNKGYALECKIDYVKARECYDRAIKLDPNYAEAWLNKAFCCSPFGAFNEEYFNKAIKLKPGFPEAWCRKGHHLYYEIVESGWALSKHQSDKEEARKYANEAIGCFDKAITIKPDYATAWLYKADCYFLIAETRIGRKEIKTYYEDAIKFYEKAVNLQPDMLNDNVLENLGISHDNIGQYDKALKFFDRVKQGINIAYNKGKTFSHMGKYKEAIQCFDKILEQHGEMHERVKVLDDKGNALKALGKADEARKCFEEARKIEKSLR